jgi:hypothetical protein
MAGSPQAAAATTAQAMDRRALGGTSGRGLVAARKGGPAGRCQTRGFCQPGPRRAPRRRCGRSDSAGHRPPGLPAGRTGLTDAGVSVGPVSTLFFPPGSVPPSDHPPHPRHAAPTRLLRPVGPRAPRRPPRSHPPPRTTPSARMHAGPADCPLPLRSHRPGAGRNNATPPCGACSTTSRDTPAFRGSRGSGRPGPAGTAVRRAPTRPAARAPGPGRRSLAGR